GIAFGETIDLDALRDDAQHRAVAQRALAQVPAGLQRRGEIAAIGRATVHAQRGADRNLPLDVEIQAGVAELAVDPGAALGMPADEAAQGGLGLVPSTAALAPVVVLASIAGEAAKHQVAAGPAQAGGERRTCAVVVVAMSIALEIAAQVHPPAAPVLRRSNRELRADALGAATAGHRRRMRQYRDLARPL